MPPDVALEPRTQLPPILIRLQRRAPVAKVKPDELRHVSRRVHRPVERSSTLTPLEGQDLMHKTKVVAAQRPQGDLVVGRPEPAVQERVALTHQLGAEEHCRGAAEHHWPVQQDLARDLRSLGDVLPVGKPHEVDAVV